LRDRVQGVTQIPLRAKCGELAALTAPQGWSGGRSFGCGFVTSQPAQGGSYPASEVENDLHLRFSVLSVEGFCPVEVEEECEIEMD